MLRAVARKLQVDQVVVASLHQRHVKMLLMCCTSVDLGKDARQSAHRHAVSIFRFGLVHKLRIWGCSCGRYRRYPNASNTGKLCPNFLPNDQDNKRPNTPWDSIKMSVPCLSFSQQTSQSNVFRGHSQVGRDAKHLFGHGPIPTALICSPPRCESWSFAALTPSRSASMAARARARRKAPGAAAARHPGYEKLEEWWL